MIHVTEKLRVEWMSFMLKTQYFLVSAVLPNNNNEWVDQKCNELLEQFKSILEGIETEENIGKK